MVDFVLKITERDSANFRQQTAGEKCSKNGSLKRVKLACPIRRPNSRSCPLYSTTRTIVLMPPWGDITLLYNTQQWPRAQPQSRRPSLWCTKAPPPRGLALHFLLGPPLVTGSRPAVLPLKAVQPGIPQNAFALPFDYLPTNLSNCHSRRLNPWTTRSQNSKKVPKLSSLCKTTCPTLWLKIIAAAREISKKHTIIIYY